MRWLARLQNMNAHQAANLLEAAHPGVAEGLPGRVAIVGATHLGEATARACAACGIVVTGMCDDAPARQGTHVAGHLVRPSAWLDELDRNTPVVLATHRLLGLSARVRSMGFSHVWPFALLALRWPGQFTPHPFYENLHTDLLDNADRLARLDALLADDLSRYTLDAVIAFRLTLDVAYLAPVLRPDAYFPPDILALHDDETYVDGGAFTGDTIRDFLAHTGGRCRSVVAFEPSPGTYDQLQAAFADHAEVKCLQACLYSRDTELHFGGTDARDATITVRGGQTCTARCIDTLPEAPLVSLIKLNIEGAEADALRGARHTIARNAPKLAVAAYHRPDDLWRLPEMMLEMQPGYVLHLRQHDGGIIETVLYAHSCPQQGNGHDPA